MSVARLAFINEMIMLALLPGTAHSADDPPDEGRDAVDYQRSLPTETDDEGWASPGFRLSLGYGYGFDEGLGALPGASVHTIIVRLGARLDADWSLLGSFQYGIASGGFDGLVYSLTIDPTWHLPAGFELAVGLGVSGLVAVSSDQPYPNPYFEDTGANTHSRTAPDAKYPFSTCSGGTGPAALVRLGWMVALDDIWALSLHAEGYGRWDVCRYDSADIDDTGELIVGRQWWAMFGATFGASFAWR